MYGCFKIRKEIFLCSFEKLSRHSCPTREFSLLKQWAKRYFFANFFRTKNKTITKPFPFNILKENTSYRCKMHVIIWKSKGSITEKAAQIRLLETMNLNYFLTGPQPRIGYIIRDNTLKILKKHKYVFEQNYIYLVLI